MRPEWIVLLLVAPALAGCLADLVDNERNALTAADAAPGQPEHHGEPEIAWGPVHTELSTSVPFGWRAWQTATITNDFGGASYSVVTLETDSGGIDVRALEEAPAEASGDAPGYLVLATREGYGASEEQAIEAMEAVELAHSDELRGDTLHLTTVMDASEPDPSGDPLGLLDSLTAGNGGRIEVYLPDGPRHEVHASTGSGGIDVAGLRLSLLAADAGSGGIDVEDVDAAELVLSTGSGGIDVADSFVDAVAAETGSGGIDLEGSFASIDAETGSGGIDVVARPFATGTYTFSSGSGGVDVSLKGTSRNGYDVEASTGSGDIDIDIPGGERLDDGDGERYQHVRTRGYDGKGIRTAITADTGSGGVTIVG